MISVVAPCLNEERCLPTFFQGLLHQSFTDFELIVVDGGSVDDSLKIIKAFGSRLKKKGIKTILVIDRTRNLGYIRNIGGDHANGKIMFQCNTDNYFEPNLFKNIHNFFEENKEVISLSGRVYPLGSNIIAHVGYQLFDLLRFLFTKAPNVIRKYRPSGNFTSFLTSVWHEVEGYPEAHVNEDGLLGERLDKYARANNKRVAFSLQLYVGHHVKKFEQMGGINALLFYFYTLGNFSSYLKVLLKPIEQKASLVFQGKPLTKISVSMILANLWNWL